MTLSVDARWFRMGVRATVHHPRLLVLTDTWNRWWTATDNGRPHPRRGPRAAGHRRRTGAHEVLLSFRYPVFWAGMALTLAGWAGVGVVLWRARRRRGTN